MPKRVLLALALVGSALSGYAFGQKDVRPLPGAPTVYMGDDFGFRAHGLVGQPESGSGWVPGQFVVKVQGRWVEARMGGTIVR